MQHPARKLPFKDLHDGLREAVDRRLVSERRLGADAIYCYTPKTVYEREWNDITLIARGLILDHHSQHVVATPYPKFFNLGEMGKAVPDLVNFEATEKLDGSLIIIWYDEDDGWRTATKGSFESNQAAAAQVWLDKQNKEPLHKGFTYLAEWVAPDNRIVVTYERPELVLLSYYDRDGYEPLYPIVYETAKALGWKVATRIHFDSINDLVTHTSTLTSAEEGFVVRFTDGTRLKIKGEEYRRIHALISGCTPLSIWQMLQAGDNLEIIRQQLPEEFWVDFNSIINILNQQTISIIEKVDLEARKVAAWTDKEVGLNLQNWPEDIRSFIFSYRKNNGNLLIGKPRQALFRSIRPTGNVLNGYTPSYAMNRVIEESI